MNYIDILLLLPLLYGAYRGFSKGLIIEIATLLGLVMGVFVSIKYSVYVENFLRDFLDIASVYLSYIALAITFLLVVILIYLLGKLLTKLVDVVSLGLANKLFGTIMGILKAFLVVCVLLLILHALDDKFHFIAKQAKDKSLLFYPFLNFAEKLYNMIRY